jgi:tetratricopeptide (TPR) repeat protein
LTGIANFLTLQVLLVLAVVAAPAAAEPRKPHDLNEVLERLPLMQAGPDARRLAALRRRMLADPAPGIAAQLGQAYFDLSLARGDPRYVGYAEAVVARFSDPLPPELLLVRGQLRQYRHDFGGALDDFAATLKADPKIAAAHAWRAAIFLVQADYPAAGAECDVLRRLGRDSLAGGCSGLLLAYSGRMGDAESQLRAGLAASRDPGNRLWLLARLGELAAWRGVPAQAERNYREALALGQDDIYLLAAWGDFLLDQNRPSDVLRELAAWEASDNLLLRLAEAAARLRRPEAGRLAGMLEDRFAAARLRGDTTHRAEEARFHLRIRGDARAALPLAVENYRVQREPRDARILLEAAIAAGDAKAAQPVRDWLRNSGFEDARMRRLGEESALAGRR